MLSLNAAQVLREPELAVGRHVKARSGRRLSPAHRVSPRSIWVGRLTERARPSPPGAGPPLRRGLVEALEEVAVGGDVEVLGDPHGGMAH